MGDGYTITRCDPRHDTDEEIAERFELSNILREESDPTAPPPRLERVIASHRHMPERIRRIAFRARDADGRLVGGAGTAIDPDHDDNPDMLWVNVHVLPDHRGRGVGRRLVTEMVDFARSDARTRMVMDTIDTVPAGIRFAELLGGEAKQAWHINRLVCADVARAQLEQWVAEAPSRAPDYELLAFDGPVPDDIVEDFVDLVHVMNTAPRDDLEMNDFTFTVEQLREEERIGIAAGLERWTVVVRRTSDGALAGFHDVHYDPKTPPIVHVGATGVRPEHRGFAIGKWLKAAIQLRILDELPEFTEVRTGNADSNDAMLGINHAMGYKPFAATTTWEFRVDRVAEALARG